MSFIVGMDNFNHNLHFVKQENMIHSGMTMRYLIIYNLKLWIEIGKCQYYVNIVNNFLTFTLH